MPYIFTEKANAQFGIRGLKFETYLDGRTWKGFARVSDEISQQALVYPQITEITESQYGDLKKNAKPSTGVFVNSQMDATKSISAQNVVVEVGESASDLLIVGE
jgi:hypothetical protein